MLFRSVAAPGHALLYNTVALLCITLPCLCGARPYGASPLPRPTIALLDSAVHDHTLASRSTTKPSRCFAAPNVAVPRQCNIKRCVALQGVTLLHPCYAVRGYAFALLDLAALCHCCALPNPARPPLRVTLPSHGATALCSTLPPLRLA